MIKLLRLSATSVAVLATLALTACGGSDDNSLFAGATSTHSLFVPAPAKPETEAPAVEPPKPNADSSEFTTFVVGIADGAASQASPKWYLTSRMRGGLHDDMKEAYGQRFDSTFRYATKVADGSSEITDKWYRNDDAIPLQKLGNGHKIYTLKETAQTHIDGVQYSGERTSRIQLYQQPNSIVLGRQTLFGEIGDGKTLKPIASNTLRIDQIRGTPFVKKSFEEVVGAQEALNGANQSQQAAQKAYDDALAQNRKNQSGQATSFGNNPQAPEATQIDTAPLKQALEQSKQSVVLAKLALDKVSKQHAIFAQGLEFNYVGGAFSKNSTQDTNARFEYAINFNTRTGHGKITGLDTGTINLNNAQMGVVTHTNPDEVSGQSEQGNSLNMLGMQGVANFADGRKDGTYTLGIFGEYAEEVAGIVTEDNVNTVGFGGLKK